MRRSSGWRPQESSAPCLYRRSATRRHHSECRRRSAPMLTDTTRVRRSYRRSKIIRGDKPLARGRKQFSISRPLRSSNRFSHVAYCNVNSPFAVTTSSPRFHVSDRPATAPELASPLGQRQSPSGRAPIVSSSSDTLIRLGHFTKCGVPVLAVGVSLLSSAGLYRREWRLSAIGDWLAKSNTTSRLRSRTTPSRHRFAGENCCGGLGSSFEGNFKKPRLAQSTRMQRPIWAYIRPRSRQNSR